jgi:hypothetical protein
MMPLRRSTSTNGVPGCEKQCAAASSRRHIDNILDIDIDIIVDIDVIVDINADIDIIIERRRHRRPQRHRRRHQRQDGGCARVLVSCRAAAQHTVSSAVEERLSHRSTD